MTEKDKIQLLHLLNIALNHVKYRPSLANTIANAHNVIKDIMSVEEIDHRSGTYEPEYQQ